MHLYSRIGFQFVVSRDEFSAYNARIAPCPALPEILYRPLYHDDAEPPRFINVAERWYFIKRQKTMLATA
jgi:hypothetical protein